MPHFLTVYMVGRYASPMRLAAWDAGNVGESSVDGGGGGNERGEIRPLQGRREEREKERDSTIIGQRKTGDMHIRSYTEHTASQCVAIHHGIFVIILGEGVSGGELDINENM